MYVGFNDPATLTLQGGTAVAPVSIQVAGTVLAITGSIGGYSSEDYYSFYWTGGSFSATASLTGAPNPSSSYLFSAGLAGTCDSGGSAALNNADGFTGTINANLGAGQYCIGIDANNISDPQFTLDFNTPVTAQAPEPNCFVLFSIGAAGIGLLRCKARRG